MLEEGWRLFAGHEMPNNMSKRDVSGQTPGSPENPVDRSEQLMPQRLAGYGLDPDFIEATDPALFDAMKARCAHCPDPEACARDMARGDLDSGMERYCPNASAIDQLVLDRASGKDNK